MSHFSLISLARRRLRPIARDFSNRIVSQSDVMARLTSIQHEMLRDHLDLARPDATPADRALREVLALLRPCGTPARRLIRVGAEHDGGYVMADDFRDAVLLSMGVGWDDSWEAHALSLGGKKCLQFDHTIRRPPRRLPRTRHIRMAISTSSSRNSMDLASVLASGEIEPSDSLVAKMDIEGYEWPVLASAPEEFIRRCRQLVVEFHEFRRLIEPDWAACAIATLRRMRQHLLPVHVHANNAVDFARLGNLAVPDAMEVSFVSLAGLLATGTPCATRSDLDRPSDPRIPEVDLEPLLAASESVG